MPVRYGYAQTLAARRLSVGAGHVGLGPGLVDEHQALGLQVDLAVEPLLASGQDVRSVLFRRVGGLFFTRDTVAGKEPLDRPVAEVMALLGQRPP